MIEHDECSYEYSGTYLVIDHGKPDAEGLPEEIAKNVKVDDVYMGVCE